MTDKESAYAEALKQQADELGALAHKHVAKLRAIGQDDLADEIEDVAKNARSFASEFNT